MKQQKTKECTYCQYWDINCGETCPKCGRTPNMTVEQQKVKVVWNDVCEQIKKDTIEQILNIVVKHVLNLECLKEEEPDEFDDFIGTDRIETKNKLRKEIKEEINNLK